MPARSEPEQQPQGLLMLLIIGGLLWWSQSGGDNTPPVPPTPPAPVVEDVLTSAYEADRKTQVAVLRELAQQPFDGATSQGLEAGVKWFNANRFRNRAADFETYSNAVAEAIQKNAEAELGAKLEGGK
jgi:hypothetical protein